MGKDISVYIDKRIESQYVYFSFLFYGGTAAENNQTIGMSHYIEHLLLNTNNSLKTFFADHGMSINGETTRESICLWGYFPKEEVGTFIPVLINSVFEEDFDIEEIDRNKKIVLCEIDQYQNIEKMTYKENRSLYKGSLWENDILGGKEQIISYSEDEIKSFKNTIINNGDYILVLRGNVDISLLQRCKCNYRFMLFEKKEGMTLHECSKPFFNATKYRNVRDEDFGYGDISVIYKINPLKDENSIPCLAIFNTALTCLNNAILTRRLREEKNYVYQVLSYPELYQSLSVFKVKTRTSISLAESVIEEIMYEINRFDFIDAEYKDLFDLARNKVRTEIERQEESDPARSTIQLAKDLLFQRTSAMEVMEILPKLTCESVQATIDNCFSGTEVATILNMV